MDMLITFVSLAVLVDTAIGANITVGGANGGWDPSTNLQAWASSQKFYTGDNLIFRYGPSHDVLEVSKTSYNTCDSSNPMQNYRDGNTVVPLPSTGNRYFICGTSGHCTQGMKVLIIVTTPATLPSFPSTPPPTSSQPPPAPITLLPPNPPSSLPTPPPSNSSSPPPAAPPSNSSSPSPTAPPLNPPSPITVLPLVPSVAPPPPTIPSSGSSSGSRSPTSSISPPPPSAANGGRPQLKLRIGFGFGIIMILAL